MRLLKRRRRSTLGCVVARASSKLAPSRECAPASPLMFWLLSSVGKRCATKVSRVRAYQVCVVPFGSSVFFFPTLRSTASTGVPTSLAVAPSNPFVLRRVLRPSSANYEVAVPTIPCPAHSPAMVLPWRPARRRCGRELSNTSTLRLAALVLTKQIIDGGANFGIAYASEWCLA